MNEAQDRADRLIRRISGKGNAAEEHAEQMVAKLTGSTPRREDERKGAKRIVDKTGKKIRKPLKGGKQ